VDCKKDLEAGADTLCPNPKNDISESKNIVTICFILFNY